MSTNSPKKRHTEAEIEALLKELPTTKETCQDLCTDLDVALTDLDDIQEIPVKLRANYRIALLRQIKAITVQMKAQKCPPCV
jgi:hypothetical protein